MSAAQPTRRSVLATSAAAAAVSLLPEHPAAAPYAKKGVTSMADAIRPFRINVPDEALAALFSAELRAAFRSLRQSI